MVILYTGKVVVNLKILFVNPPYHGHVIPTIGLVRQRIRLGIR